jgi:transposase
VLSRTPQEAIDLILCQHEQVVALQARMEALEAQRKKNSSNSNKPPSSDSPFKAKPSGSAKPHAKTRKRKGHRQVLLNPTDVRHLLPRQCSCGCTHFEETEAFHTHQVLELPEIKPLVEHWHLHRGRCAQCGKMVKAVLPPEKHTGYGPRLSAMIVELLGSHSDSRRAVEDFLFSVFGLSISQGAMQKIVDRASRAIVPHYQAIEAVAQAASVNHIDETSWKTRKELRWLWVMANTKTAYFRLHGNRSQKAFEELVGDWDGLLVSDGYALYRKWKHGRQTCLAHLIRRAKAVSEHPTRAVAKIGAWILNELRLLCRMAHDPPTRGEWGMLYARLMRIFRRHGEDKDAAGGLVRNLMKEGACLWTFLRQEGVGPTNNHAERMLRFPVIWRKRSFGTRNEKGERFVERMLSLRQTCRIQLRRTYPVLVDAFQSLFAGRQPDTAFIHS